MAEKGKEPLLPPELEDVDSISYAWFRVRKRVLFGAKNFKKIYAHYLSAQSELNEATDYYEECRPGLGLEFAKEVYSAIQLITQFPEAWPPLSENTRRCLRISARWPRANGTEVTGAEEEGKSELLLAGPFGAQSKRILFFSGGGVFSFVPPFNG